MKHHCYCYSCCLLVLFVGDISNARNTKTFDLKTGVKMVIQTWFPDDIEFNKSCLTEGCPGLNNFSLCPAEVDVDRMNSLLDIISGCMRGTICGIQIDRRPYPHVRMSVDELLSGTSIKAFLTTIPDAGYLSNVSNMELELVPGQTGRLPIQMNLRTPSMRGIGRFDVEAHFPKELLPRADQQLDMNLENVTFDATYQFYSTISLNKSSNSSQIEIEFRKPIIKTSHEFCGMDTPNGLPNIVQLFAQLTKNFIEKSGLAISKAKLLRKLFQCAIDIVSKDCMP